MDKKENRTIPFFRGEPILRWSIGTKLIIAFLALAIIPMSITAYYNLTHGQDEVVKVAKENLIELSRGTAHRIEQLLVENQRTSATLAGEPLVAQFLAASEEERQAITPQIYQILKNFADTHPYHDAPGILDVNGIVIASLADILVGKDRSFRDYFQASIKGESYVSDILVGRSTGRAGVFLTNHVVTAEGKIVGIDIVWLKGDAIWDIIDDVKVGEEGIAYLVDQDGVIIAHPNRDLLYHSLGKLTPDAAAIIFRTIRFGTIKVTKTPLIPKSLGIDELATELVSAQGSDTYRYYSPFDHRNHVVGYTRLEAHPWTVVVDLPEGQFLAPMQRLRSVAWISVGLVGIISLIISILLVRGITRPIRSLTDTAIAVEQGQPFEPSDIQDVTSGRDEIAHLGRVFSGMVLALRQELTERKQAEEEKRKVQAQLQQSQKMEAIGTLAGGIAHDFNNILSLIMGYTELSMMNLPEDSPVRDNMNKLFKAGERARDLVKQILTFSRHTEYEQKPLQIHLIVKKALKLLRPSLPTTIEIRQNIASTGMVMADPTQMHQVIMNLSTNAYHAMQEKGGVLDVSLADVELDSDFTARHLDTHTGPYIRFTVSDTGHGIEKKDIDRIFEPYYTTKEKTGGTGMGLAVVHGIVKSYRGAITVYSEPGKGTTFNVFLPRIEEAKVETETEEMGPIPTGNERILLVDDESAIVDIGKGMLENLGYTVEIRTSPIEALEAFKAQPDKFDLVITDMTMPKITGDELASAHP